jgi:hypothetical protein
MEHRCDYLLKIGMALKMYTWDSEMHKLNYYSDHESLRKSLEKLSTQALIHFSFKPLKIQLAISKGCVELLYCEI